MSSGGGVSGRYVSYFKEYKHWTFPEHKTFISISAVIFDNPGWEMISKKYPTASLLKCVLYAAT